MGLIPTLSKSLPDNTLLFKTVWGVPKATRQIDFGAFAKTLVEVPKSVGVLSSFLAKSHSHLMIIKQPLMA